MTCSLALDHTVHPPSPLCCEQSQNRCSNFCMVWGWRLLHRAGHPAHSQNVRFWHKRHYLRKMLPLFGRWGEKGGMQRADGGLQLIWKLSQISLLFFALVLSLCPPISSFWPSVQRKNKQTKKAFLPSGGVRCALLQQESFQPSWIL